MLGTLKKDFKYKIVDNFFSKEELIILNNYTDIRHKDNRKSFDHVQSNTMDTYFFADPLMESLMIQKQSLMEKETNSRLFPTYSFWRMYTYGAELLKHKDRPSCEISVTAMIGSDGTEWPIYMDGKPYNLNPGQAMIYLGCEVEHWREPFAGDWQAQAFMHYVDAEGVNADYKWDRRNFIGQTSS
tara:strand:- start:3981 stop:4535 length:555 start_codon:yes stop_codon:yes gene_type:complete